MRKLLIPLAAAGLCGLALSSSPTPGQDLAQDATRPAQKFAAQAPAPQQPATADSPDQPMSVAEMARAARAKKPTDAKPVPRTSKLLDDANMPRGVYAADAAPAKPAAPGSETLPAPTSGAPFPEFRGKVILLDFWASWCGPCRNALPNLKRLQAVYGGADFVVISVSEDDDESAWHAFVSSHNMTWPQRLDSDGSIQRQFGVNALPTYVLIGRDGTVLQKFIGEAPAESIVERIGPDLKASLAAKP
jgi:thiol-disulfide isomerase/thioredoxin